MLVFSAICPHPPILIPDIGKDNLKKIKDTFEAMKKLEQELYAAKPDIILVISPHGEIIHDAFCINLNSSYKADFEEFGDFTTKMEFKSSPPLALKIKERVEDELPIVLSSNEKLDHGAAVPLYYLTKHLKNIDIIPISYCLLDYDKHFKFGQLIKKEIAKSEKRIAVIASGDLSHGLSKDAPAGYIPSGAEFDNELITLLKRKDIRKILKMNHKLIEKAAECGFRSFAILFGIIEEYQFDVDVLSYEGPFGVGYLVANIKLV
ncbi:MAG: AmmeMemoRadiSam system protein B [Candidatus Buchananbacteria bacterium RBG_13_36_9]|jgi:aromatic ring-opening dioxygenase LigB subunit|uniref:AmmeMemoRadiSam system protein B n=1 Tax=Candidatus Buchananbacteria bacterium RBG_13_36_9 TaxID=1797530 RepID=A0A1G1XS04_9BACT|nr:MAG: AmmeMemoRadiSam system protein B [Candidatus Buchananbacteria bacterium RBG_13_36_9]